MNTSRLTEVLKYKAVAVCTKGAFLGAHATKNEKGHVILVEKDVSYDFWDNRFADCVWEIA